MIIQRFSCDVLDPNIYSAVDRGVQASVGPKGTCPEWILWVRTSPVALNECALRAYTYQSSRHKARSGPASRQSSATVEASQRSS